MGLPVIPKMRFKLVGVSVMKRYIYTLIVSLLLSFLFSGCGFWMNGEHVSVTPHQQQIPQLGNNVIEIVSLEQIQGVLEEFVETGAESCILSSSAFESNKLRQNVDDAIRNVVSKNPIAAYAVEGITYEIGTNRGVPVVAFQIEYQHGRSEILRIKQTNTMDEATALIANALDNCEDSAVLRVRQYESMDFAQLVQDYGNQNPDVVMEIPKVLVSSYPQTGEDRVIEVVFTYQTSREKIKQMQEQVSPVFAAAELYVKQTGQASEMYSHLYSFLMERNDYRIETSITPAYSLLYHGVGDSRAFANIYANMCRRAKLDCRVVSGTREGEPWCWNVVIYRGKYYHIDLLDCSEKDRFEMRKAQQMDGYVWDYAVYPAE